MIANKYMTVAEVAEALGRTPQRVRQLIESGQLPAEDAHQRLKLVKKSDFEKFRANERPTGVHIDRRKRS